MDMKNKLIAFVAIMAMVAAVAVLAPVDDVDAADIDTTAVPVEHPDRGTFVVVAAPGYDNGINASGTIYSADGNSISFTSAVVDGSVYCGPVTLADGDYTIEVTVGEDTLRASFTIGAYTFTVADVDNATIVVTDAEGNVIEPGTAVAVGAQLTATVIPDEGYQVVGESTWDVTDMTEIALPEGVTIEPIVVTYTITFVSVENGEISVADAEGNPIASGAEVADGTTVTLTVTAHEGYEIVSVTVNGEPVVLTDGAYTFTVGSDVSIEADIQEIVLLSVDVNYDNVKTEYQAGDSLDLSGLVVTGTYSDGSVASVTDYTTSPENGDVLDIAGDVTVTVTVDGFEPVTFQVTVTMAYTVTFYDGEKELGRQTVADGMTATDWNPDEVNEGKDKKPGMTFVRWNTENGRAYNFDTPVTGDLNLYAMYELSPTNEMTVSGESNTGDTTFDYNQIVTVNGTWTLVAGANITIQGQLVVPEGATLIIEPGATLTLAGVDGSEMGPVADIQGSIVIENDAEDVLVASTHGTLELQSGEMSVSGSIDVAGELNVSGGTMTVEADAGVTVADNGKLEITAGQADVYGTVTVNGVISAAKAIGVYGTVVIDSSVVNNGVVNVNIMAAGAVVDVQRYTVSSTGGMYITDANLVFKAATSTSDAVTVTYANTVVLTVTAGSECNAEFSGLYVTESVSQRTVNGVVRYTNTMDVSGDMGVYATYNGDGNGTASGSATVVITAGKAVSVSNEIVVGDDVAVSNAAASGVMTVTGSVDATAEDSEFTNDGTVTLSDNGIVTLKDANKTMGGTVNATMYSTTGSDAVTTYVTIDAALATVNQDGNEIRTITVYGEQTVTVSATLPANVTMQLSAGSDLQVGDTRNGSDVVLTVAEGADVRGSADITVNGTLYAEDKRDINSAVDIISDVYSEEVDSEGKAVRDGWARWTNIYTAVSEANPGDVIVINKAQDEDNDQYVVLSKNLTIPAGVTVVVNQGMASLYLMDGVTLTIAGTLQTYEDVYAETRFANTAMDIDAVNNNPAKKSSAIVVTGTLESFMVGNLEYGDGTSAISGGAPIAGAYYLTADSSVISSLEVALANVADIIGGIEVNGPINAGDLTFTATEDCDTITVSGKTVENYGADTGRISTVLTVGSLTVANGGKVTVAGEINGTVVIGEASVELSDITGITVTDDEGMTVSGAVSEAVAGGDDCFLTVAAGSVTVASNSVNVDVNVAAGATLVSNGARLNGTTAVDGTLDITTVNDGNKSVYASDLVINADGVFAVDSGEYADVDTLTVYGDFTVAAETATAQSGNADVDVLYAGISKKDIEEDGVDGTTGTVSGDMNGVTKAYVSAQATLDDDAVASMPDYETQLSVEGSVWFTFYGSDLILPEKAPVENAYVSGWYDADADASYALGYSYDADADAVLTASIEYNVYRIYVLANEAVDDVFIDGNLMQYGTIFGDDMMAYYGYYAVVAAGNHEISYTLANGYSGDGVLTVDGTQMSGMTFTTEGQPTEESVFDSNVLYKTYNLQLSGFEKSGYVPDSPDTPSDSGDDGGMSITDILLIVLVILIIVMAIIVAVRLMRS